MATPRRTRRSKILRRAGGVLGGLVVAALAVELVWRLGEPEPLQPPVIRAPDGTTVPQSVVATYLGREEPLPDDARPASRLSPNLDLRFCYAGRGLAYLDENGCVPVRTNSLGFRDEEFARDKPPGETRVLAVGDSFTFGHGVRAEDCWVERLEAALAHERGSVQVINGGFAAGAHRTADYVPWIATDGLGLDPDLVVIGLCLNDLGDFPMAIAPPPVESPWLGGFSHVLRAIQERRQRAAFEAASLPDAAQLLDLVPQPWLETRTALRTMRDLCAERDVAFLVVVFPMFFRLERERYPFLGVHARITEFCADAGIDCVDLYPAFEGLDDRSLWVHASDQHANPRGHALIAANLLPEVRRILAE